MGAQIGDSLAITFDRLLGGFKGPVKHIVLSTTGGWTNTGVASGSVVVNDPFKMVLRAAASASSSILSRNSAYGLNTNSLATNLLDWTKRLLFLATIARDTSDAQAVSYMQIKEATAIGQVAARGIEIRASNLTLEGFAYGTSLSSAVAFATNLTNAQAVLLGILLTANGVEFFLDNVSQGTITTAGKFPAAVGTAEADIMFSHANGAAGTQSDLYVGSIHIFQEV